jgi:hypothetical protein
MRAWLRRWWPALKVVLAVAILASVGWRLAWDLQDLRLGELELRPGWLAASGLLYVAALGFSGWFWVHLLRVFGQRPALWPAARAYYVSHLGKYVPGKAWALLLRGTMVRGPDVRLGVAILSSFYEVLTTMAAGALVAAALFAWQPGRPPPAWPGTRRWWACCCWRWSACRFCRGSSTGWWPGWRPASRTSSRSACRAWPRGRCSWGWRRPPAAGRSWA